ncbi:MAG: hypothetical protein ABSF29_03155 [Tepidisphaeraceae bacterium]|jgi:hypothetical protein
MDAQDAELADVVVILADPLPLRLEEAVEQLRGAGLTVDDVDAENGAIEGTTQVGLIKPIQSMPFVKYVRKVFEYTAEPPSPDPSDDESPESDGK